MKDENQIPTPGDEPEDRPTINWLAFWLTLLAPIITTILAVTFVSNEGDIAPFIALGGSAVSAISGGIMLGRYWGRTLAGKIGLTLVFSLLLFIVIFPASCFGCMVSGYRLNFH